MNDTLYPARLVLGRWNEREQSAFVCDDPRELHSDAEASDRIGKYKSLEYTSGLYYAYQPIPITQVDAAMIQARINIEAAQANVYPLFDGNVHEQA